MALACYQHHPARPHEPGIANSTNRDPFSGVPERGAAHVSSVDRGHPSLRHARAVRNGSGPGMNRVGLDRVRWVGERRKEGGYVPTRWWNDDDQLLTALGDALRSAEDRKSVV